MRSKRAKTQAKARTIFLW